MKLQTLLFPEHCTQSTGYLYSLTSLSRPPLSRQPRISPPVATAADVLLLYCEQCEQATEDDVQPLCAIKRRPGALAVAVSRQQG